jgi:hypothetical protein
MITVMSKLDDTDSLSGIELDACRLTDQNGTVVMDDCDDDDLDDDLEDDLDDDSEDVGEDD